MWKKQVNDTYTRVAHGCTEQTVNKQHLKQSQLEYKAFNALEKRSFACIADAETVLAHLQKTLKVVALHDSRIVEVLGFKGKGRPRKDCQPEIIGYRIDAGVASILETWQRKIQQKSCFIIASNQLDEVQLSHEAMLDHYTPGQQKVERSFRFLKDPRFMASTLFLKSPRRIMALMIIMTLCLQRQLHAGCFSFSLVSMCCLVMNCNAYHHQLLNLFGERYIFLYANSE